MRAEILTVTENCYTIEVDDDQVNKFIVDVMAAINNGYSFQGVTIEGMRFGIAPGRIDSVMIYNEAQALEQHRRVVRSKLQKRSIERELSPFEDIE